MLRREIPTGTQERGEDTHKRTRTRKGRSGPRLRARGEQEAPTRQDSRAATSTAQRGSTATDQDAFQPPASTPPRQTKEGEGEGGEGVGELLVHSSHRGRCFFRPWGCQAYCSRRDPRIRCRDWPS
jgi:hypothetical protein